MSCGVRKLAIGALYPDINNSLVIGVVIAKQSLRIFTSRKDGEERGVWNFTLRDSPTDTINVTFWGSADAARKSHETYAVGDVVEIMNARVAFKQPGNSNAAFSPSVSSPFQLELLGSNSVLVHHEESDETYRHLVFVPTKCPSDFLRLSDLLSYGRAMRGDYVNLLVAIRSVGEIRNVRSRKDSRELTCRDVVVMDESHMEFEMTLWSEEVIARANAWRPGRTVIFCADVRVDWSEFKQSVTVAMTSRTIITQDPRCPQADSLRDYSRSFPLQPIAVLNHLTQTASDSAHAINTVMTTAQIADKAYSNSPPPDNKFTALLFAVVTSLDLDGSERVVAYQCSNCFQVRGEGNPQANDSCSHHGLVRPIYDLKMSLTDHRGSLRSCRLMSPTADRVLNCSVDEYLAMSPEEKTQLKWQLLLSRCEVRLLVLCKSPERSQTLFSVLTCRRADPRDVREKLPFY